MPNEWVNLHTHTEYSLLDGFGSAERWAARAKALGQPALAVTDHGSMYGAIPFAKACKAEGIKSITGCELYVAPGNRADKPEKDGPLSERLAYTHLIALAADDEGYRNLSALVTRANLEGFYRKPRVDREILAEHNKGLIVLSGCLGSELAQAILKDDHYKAAESFDWYRHTFGDRFYVEIQNHGQDEDRTYNAQAIAMARAAGVPLVATADCHYPAPDDWRTHDMTLAIQTGATVDKAGRFQLKPPHRYYLPSADEMAELFSEAPESLASSLEIAERCTYKPHLDGRLPFPDLSHAIGSANPTEWLQRKCQHVLDGRFLGYVPQKYQDRLAYELRVIRETGFSEYMILVWDFVNWARARGIECTPRGSAAGSIVLWLLGVSPIDPIAYDLTFERFLNPERVQMPDVDMDFADHRRQEVVSYVVERYGREHVAQIATIGRMMARGAIKDAGRALGYDLETTDRLSKLVPTHPVGTTITAAMETVEDLSTAYHKESDARAIIDAAKSIEGGARSSGIHAAGIVVSAEPLTHHVPLQRAGSGSDAPVAQYGMKELEAIGLLKMDFLGLANLSMLERARANIARTRGKTLDLDALPEDDPRTWAMLAAGDTHSVFQLEGSGMTAYCRQLKPQSIRHLAALVALYRPGPLEHIPSYIARRAGTEPVTYLHKDLRPILESTYGVIVYQDQVLRILQVIGGYSLGQADIVRKAMGKKDPKLMAEEGARFIQGAVGKGYSTKLATQLWEYILPFAGYAFNAAHATCYGRLAFQTAYLKANFPVEWMAAVLETHGKPEDLTAAVAEAKRLGVPVLGPDVNESGPRFGVVLRPDGTLAVRFGLAAVKQVGDPAAEAIIHGRASGRYTGLEDLVVRSGVNKRVLEFLVKAGALDGLGERPEILARLEWVLPVASAVRKLLADAPEGFKMPELRVLDTAERVAAWTDRQTLAYEREALGMAFSRHPFTEAAASLRAPRTNAAEIGPDLDGHDVALAGAVVGYKEVTTRTGKTMARIDLEDLTGRVQVVAFPRLWCGDKRRDDDPPPKEWLGEDVVVTAKGRVEAREDDVQVILEKLQPWEGYRKGVR